MPTRPFRLATRRSPLAMAQARQVQRLLAARAGVPMADMDACFPILPFITTGDRVALPSLVESGGKGLFTKEIEAALLAGEADIGVHSMKDMPAHLPEGLVIAGVPLRADPRDAFVTRDGTTLAAMREGVRLGTSSIRRAAQLRRLRPDVIIVPLRGNVGTRLQRLQDGEIDGTFLAEAGLGRLGLDDVRRHAMDVADMVPAAGQGALCLETRADDSEALARCRDLEDRASALAVAAERGVVVALDGSCRTPIGAHARLAGDGLDLIAEILAPDGSFAHRIEGHLPGTQSAGVAAAMATLSAADSLGVSVAERLLAAAGPDARAQWW